MKIFSHFAVGITIATLLGGCGGSPTPQAGTQAVPFIGVQQLRQPTAGGTFSASFAGGITREGDCYLNRRPEEVKFHGSGHAAFLLQSDEHGTLHKTPGFRCEPDHGMFILTSDAHPDDSIQMYMSSTKNRWRFTVVHGTGRFESATGTGAWSFTLKGDRYEDTWDGVLIF